MRLLARKRAPRAVFDYVDGAAGYEVSLERSRNAFRRAEFRPTVLAGVTEPDTSTSILGRHASMPVICAPTGFTRMMHTAGERAVLAAAHRVGIPHALSTMGTTTPEELAASCPDADRWFQLYVWNDREASAGLMDRARAAGYRVLVVTVDTPVAGQRLRDVRNGLTIPPKLTPSTLLDMAMHPAWWFDLLTTEPLEFATLTGFDGTVAELVNQLFDPSADLETLAWAKEAWGGPLVVKGVQTAEDARRVVDAGADAVVVSNHGGRQLDQAPVPLFELPAVVEAIGDDAEVYIDGGVMSGTDVAAAVGLGATAVLIGRAYLYGLMAGGEAGVDRVLELIRAQLGLTMQLVGVPRLDDLRGRVSLT